MAFTRNVNQNTDHRLSFATDHLGKKVERRLNLTAFPAIARLREVCHKNNESCFLKRNVATLGVDNINSQLDVIIIILLII